MVLFNSAFIQTVFCLFSTLLSLVAPQGVDQTVKLAINSFTKPFNSIPVLRAEKTPPKEYFI
jgi:hypothetical protein